MESCSLVAEDPKWLQRSLTSWMVRMMCFFSLIMPVSNHSLITKMQSLLLTPLCCLCLQPLGFLPVVTVGLNQLGRLNLGRQVSSLQYYPVCGRQEGYQPFAVNMSRDPALWMSWKQPQFTSITSDCHNLQVETTACKFSSALTFMSIVSFLVCSTCTCLALISS